MFFEKAGVKTEWSIVIVSRTIVSKSIIIGIIAIVSPAIADAYAPFLSRVVPDDNSIILEIELPGVDTLLVTNEYGNFYKVMFPDADYESTPGFPQLPYLVYSIGVPDGVIHISTEIIEDTTIQLAYPPYPADSFSEDAFGKYNIALPFDEEKYLAKSNQRWATVVDAGFIRSQKIAQVVVNPVRYAYLSKKLECILKMKVKVEFSGGGAYIDEGAFESVLKKTIVNYEQAKHFRINRSLTSVPDNIFSYSDVWYQIPLKSDGVYAITSSWLSGLGINLSAIEPSQIRLFAPPPGFLSLALPETLPGLQEIPMLEISDGLPGFIGDTLIFYWDGIAGWGWNYGQPRWFTSPYCDSFSLWLSIGGNFDQPAKRISDSDIPSQENKIFWGWTATRNEVDRFWSGSRWYWENATQMLLYLNDDRIPESPEDGKIWMEPITNNFYVNGSSCYSGILCNLHPGSNEIRLIYTTPVNFDYWAAKYPILLAPKNGFLIFATDTNSGKFVLNVFSNPLALDITDLFLPAKKNLYFNGDTFFFDDTCKNRKYLVFDRNVIAEPPVPLRQTNFYLWESSFWSVDYVIITADELDPRELAQFHEDRGLRVATIPLSEVMRQFGFGRYDPTAIRNCLLYGYTVASPPKPQFALFVGDGHYDVRKLTTIEPVLFPPAIYAADLEDAFFVTLDGDELWEMMSGRISVSSQAELNTVIQKIKDYMTCTPQSKWRITPILCADDEYRDDGYHDNLTYISNSDVLLNYDLPLTTLTELVYLIEYPRNSALRKPEATQFLIEKINEGGVWVNWIGHGNYHVWSHERLLDFPADLSRFHNTDKLPLVSAFSCNVSEFFRIGGDCISEQMVNLNGGGAIAFVAATGPTNASGNQGINRRFASIIFGNEPVYISGAMIASRASLYPSHDSQYMLIGDPATILAFPYDSVAVEIYPETLISGSWATVSGITYPQFNGTALIWLVAPNSIKTYESPYEDLSRISYTVPGKIIFAGASSIINGSFEMPVFIPVNIAPGDKYKVVVYAYSEDECVNAVGALTGIKGYLNPHISLSDTVGPQIEIFLGENNVGDGGVVCSPDGTLPVLISVYDEHGVDMGLTVGHQLLVQIDSPDRRVDLSQEFEYALDDPTGGTARYIFENIDYGWHTVCVQAWDNLGNPSQKCIDFDLQSCGARIYDVLPYPSPFEEYTDITFVLTGDVSFADIEVEFFAGDGTFIKNVKAKNIVPPFGKIRWDGKSKRGHEVQRGVYFYVLNAEIHTSQGILKQSVKGKVAKR